jgi:hypothetical protein
MERLTGFKCSDLLLQISLHSKHCRACNKCVHGFDHHCRVQIPSAWTELLSSLNTLQKMIMDNGPQKLLIKVWLLMKPFVGHDWQWLNNCVGTRNYKPFVALMVFCLLMVCMFSHLNCCWSVTCSPVPIHQILQWSSGRMIFVYTYCVHGACGCLRSWFWSGQLELRHLHAALVTRRFLTKRSQITLAAASLGWLTLCLWYVPML